MKRISLLSMCGVFAALLLACQPAATPPVATENKPAASPATKSAAGAPDFEAIANRVVTQVAGVKEGDVVFIGGSPRDMELLEDLAIDSRKVGAFSLLTAGTDRMAKKYYEEVPEKYDTQTPDFYLKLATMPTGEINVDAWESENAL